MLLHDALRKVIRHFGVNVIEEKRLMSFIADYKSFDDYPAVKEVMRAIATGDSGKKICLAAYGSDEEFLRIASEIKETLVRERGFREEFARYAVDSVSFALGIVSSVTESGDHGYEAVQRNAGSNGSTATRKSGTRTRPAACPERLCRRRTASHSQRIPGNYPFLKVPAAPLLLPAPLSFLIPAPRLLLPQSPAIRYVLSAKACLAAPSENCSGLLVSPQDIEGEWPCRPRIRRAGQKCIRPVTLRLACTPRGAPWPLSLLSRRTPRAAALLPSDIKSLRTHAFRNIRRMGRHHDPAAPGRLGSALRKFCRSPG